MSSQETHFRQGPLEAGKLASLHVYVEQANAMPQSGDINAWSQWIQNLDRAISGKTYGVQSVVEAGALQEFVTTLQQSDRRVSMILHLASGLRAQVFREAGKSQIQVAVYRNDGGSTSRQNL